MTRHIIDCRKMPSESGCTVSVAADAEQELLEAAAHHAVHVHGHEDGPELRAALTGLVEREG